MVKTEVINETPGDLLLKEGNAGVFRDIKRLKTGDSHTIEIDPNATYREYVVVSAPASGSKVFVSSDDCIDNSTITIVVENGEYKFIGKSRNESGTSAEDAAPGGFFSRLFKKFFKK